MSIEVLQEQIQAKGSGVMVSNVIMLTATSWTSAVQTSASDEQTNEWFCGGLLPIHSIASVRTRVKSDSDPFSLSRDEAVTGAATVLFGFVSAMMKMTIYQNIFQEQT